MERRHVTAQLWHPLRTHRALRHLWCERRRRTEGTRRRGAFARSPQDAWLGEDVPEGQPRKGSPEKAKSRVNAVSHVYSSAVSDIGIYLGRSDFWWGFGVYLDQASVATFGNFGEPP